ncbi:hypothetical protein AYO47_06755, partial [Planctomyces sp. SCGC AG-212-M04]
MNERQFHFRVGLFVFTGMVTCLVLVLRFTEIQKYFKETYRVAVQFNQAPGVYRGTPVRLNGIPIGAVTEVKLAAGGDDTGVLVILEIHGDRPLRKDSKPLLVRSLFGDATIEFTAGSSPEILPPNKRLIGENSPDPLEAIGRLETRVDQTLAAFQATSKEWQTVAANINRIVDANQGRIEEVVAQAAVAVEQFTKTMRSADRALSQAGDLLGDPKFQANLRSVADELPAVARETRETIAAARETVVSAKVAIQRVSESLDHISKATDPLAAHSASMTSKLDHSLGQLDSLLTELNTFSQIINTPNGTIQKFASDPQLYDNLNRSAAALTLLMRNLEPTMADIRIFADRVARHPEILGVSGA